ncbi:MAG: LpqN/LpqT family lipoprotein [Mycobacterium sp.]
MTATPAARDPRRGGWGHRLTAVASIVLVSAAAGCSNPTNPTTGEPSTSADCNRVDYPLVDIPPRSGDAPAMQIPQPPGWEVGQTDEKEHQRLRFVQTNQALAANHYAPTSAVTLSSHPGQWPAQELFDEANSALIDSGFAEGIQSRPTTVCGQPAEISDYTMTLDGVSAPMSAKALMAVAESENETYLAVLTITTTEPDNPIYQRDSQAILDGFAIVIKDE